MIGGADLFLERPWRNDVDRPLIISFLNRYWPDLVVQNAANGRAFTIGEKGLFDTCPLGANQDEFFVYESLDAFKAWDGFGLTEENDSKMVYVMGGLNSVTFVVDRADSPLGEQVKHLIGLLSRR